MRGIVFIAAISVTLCWSSSGAYLQKGLRLQELEQRVVTRAFENIILTALKCIQTKLAAGVPELNIPPLNPIEIQEQNINLNALEISGLNGNINLSDLSLTGATDWVVTKLKGNIGIIPPRYTVSMTLSFPSIVFKSKYSIDAEYSEENVYGKGSVSFEMANFSVDVDARVKVLGGVAFEYFHSIPHLDTLKSFEVTGLMDDEKLSAEFSEMIAAHAAKIVDGLADDIDTVLGQIIVDSVNNGGDQGAIAHILKKCL